MEARAAAARKNDVRKVFFWSLWAANLLIILYFWIVDPGQNLQASFGDVILGIGGLCGLLAMFCILVQLVLMGRLSWLEPTFGMDKLAIFHRYNGFAALCFVILHPPLVVLGNSIINGISFIEQDIVIFQFYPFVVFAALGALLLFVTVGTSVFAVRKHLKFEVWYFIHLANYLVVGLVFAHQFANGSTILNSQEFSYYWAALYIFVVLNVLIWRFGLPITRFLARGFRVEKIVAESPTATSVYMTANKMQGFSAKAGQFILVRFLTKGMWWQEHPFSLSQIPNGKNFRITVRQLGDFTNQIPSLKPGTPVIVNGPFGSFTADKQRTNKVAYLAGGIGITPIMALLRERADQGLYEDAIFVYGVRNEDEIVFRQDLEAVCAKARVRLAYVISDQPSFKGEKGYIDKEKIQKLIPDVATRDVFICGPPVMVNKLAPTLLEIGVKKQMLHFERFSLHKQ